MVLELLSSRCLAAVRSYLDPVFRNMFGILRYVQAEDASCAAKGGERILVFMRAIDARLLNLRPSLAPCDAPGERQLYWAENQGLFLICFPPMRSVKFPKNI